MSSSAAGSPLSLGCHGQEGSYLIAGLMLGLSIAVWYQSAFLVLAILVMLCVKRDGKGALMTLIGIVIALLLVWVLLLILHVNPWHYIRP